MTARLLCSSTPPYRVVGKPEIYTVIPVRKSYGLTQTNRLTNESDDIFAFNMCETPAVYCHDRPKARREHRCLECRGVIVVGEMYNLHHGIFDGEPFNYKTCDDCEALRSDIDKDIPFVEERVAFGYLYEHVFESREVEWMKRYLQTKEKRQADVPQWMYDRFDDEFNKEEDKLFALAEIELRGNDDSECGTSETD